eukprot:gene4070-740_t
MYTSQLDVLVGQEVGALEGRSVPGALCCFRPEGTDSYKMVYWSLYVPPASATGAGAGGIVRLRLDKFPYAPLTAQEVTPASRGHDGKTVGVRVPFEGGSLTVVSVHGPGACTSIDDLAFHEYWDGLRDEYLSYSDLEGEHLLIVAGDFNIDLRQPEGVRYRGLARVLQDLRVEMWPQPESHKDTVPHTIDAFSARTIDGIAVSARLLPGLGRVPDMHVIHPGAIPVPFSCEQGKRRTFSDHSVVVMDIVLPSSLGCCARPPDGPSDTSGRRFSEQKMQDQAAVRAFGVEVQSRLVSGAGRAGPLCMNGPVLSGPGRNDEVYGGQLESESLRQTWVGPAPAPGELTADIVSRLSKSWAELLGPRDIRQMHPEAVAGLKALHTFFMGVRTFEAFSPRQVEYLGVDAWAGMRHEVCQHLVRNGWGGPPRPTYTEAWGELHDILMSAGDECFGKGDPPQDEDVVQGDGSPSPSSTGSVQTPGHVCAHHMSAWADAPDRELNTLLVSLHQRSPGAMISEDDRLKLDELYKECRGRQRALHQERAVAEMRDSRLLHHTLGRRSAGGRASRATALHTVRGDDGRLRNKAGEVLDETVQSKRLYMGKLDAPIDALEFDRILADLSTGTAPGIDGVTYRFLKVLPPIAKEGIRRMLSEILQGRAETPEEWARVLTVLLPKPGRDPLVLDNRRGIALGSCYLKVLQRVVMTRWLRLQEAEKVWSPLQFGVLPQSTPSVAVFRMEAILKAVNHAPGQHSHLLALDVRKAFDSLSHEALVHMLEYLQLPHAVIGMIKAIQLHSSVQVKTAHGKTKAFHPTQGVLQGMVDSAYLFALCMAPLLFELEDINLRLGVELSGGGQGFADDLILHATSQQELMVYADVVFRYLAALGLEVNMGKTQYSTTDSSASPLMLPRYLKYQPDAPSEYGVVASQARVLYLGHMVSPFGEVTIPDSIVGRLQGASRTIRIAKDVTPLHLVTMVRSLWIGLAAYYLGCASYEDVTQGTNQPRRSARGNLAAFASLVKLRVLPDRLSLMCLAIMLDLPSLTARGLFGRLLILRGAATSRCPQVVRFARDDVRCTSRTMSLCPVQCMPPKAYQGFSADLPYPSVLVRGMVRYLGMLGLGVSYGILGVGACQKLHEPHAVMTMGQSHESLGVVSCHRTPGAPICVMQCIRSNSDGTSPQTGSSQSRGARVEPPRGHHVSKTGSCQSGDPSQALCVPTEEEHREGCRSSAASPKGWPCFPEDYEGGGPQPRSLTEAARWVGVSGPPPSLSGKLTLLLMHPVRAKLKGGQEVCTGVGGEAFLRGVGVPDWYPSPCRAAGLVPCHNLMWLMGDVAKDNGLAQQVRAPVLTLLSHEHRHQATEGRSCGTCIVRPGLESRHDGSGSVMLLDSVGEWEAVLLEMERGLHPGLNHIVVCERFDVQGDLAGSVPRIGSWLEGPLTNKDHQFNVLFYVSGPVGDALGRCGVVAMSEKGRRTRGQVWWMARDVGMGVAGSLTMETATALCGWAESLNLELSGHVKGDVLPGALGSMGSDDLSTDRLFRLVRVRVKGLNTDPMAGEFQVRPGDDQLRRLIRTAPDLTWQVAEGHMKATQPDGIQFVADRLGYVRMNGYSWADPDTTVVCGTDGGSVDSMPWAALTVNGELVKVVHLPGTPNNAEQVGVVTLFLGYKAWVEANFPQSGRLWVVVLDTSIPPVVMRAAMDQGRVPLNSATCEYTQSLISWEVVQGYLETMQGRERVLMKAASSHTLDSVNNLTDLLGGMQPAPRPLTPDERQAGARPAPIMYPQNTGAPCLVVPDAGLMERSNAIVDHRLEPISLQTITKFANRVLLESARKKWAGEMPGLSADPELSLSFDSHQSCKQACFQVRARFGSEETAGLLVSYACMLQRISRSPTASPCLCGQQGVAVPDLLHAYGDVCPYMVASEVRSPKLAWLLPVVSRHHQSSDGREALWMTYLAENATEARMLLASCMSEDHTTFNLAVALFPEVRSREVRDAFLLAAGRSGLQLESRSRSALLHAARKDNDMEVRTIALASVPFYRRAKMAAVALPILAEHPVLHQEPTHVGSGNSFAEMVTLQYSPGEAQMSPVMVLPGWTAHLPQLPANMWSAVRVLLQRHFFLGGLANGDLVDPCPSGVFGYQRRPGPHGRGRAGAGRGKVLRGGPNVACQPGAEVQSSPMIPKRGCCGPLEWYLAAQIGSGFPEVSEEALGKDGQVDWSVPGSAKWIELVRKSIIEACHEGSGQPTCWTVMSADLYPLGKSWSQVAGGVPGAALMPAPVQVYGLINFMRSGEGPGLTKETPGPALVLVDHPLTQFLFPYWGSVGRVRLAALDRNSPAPRESFIAVLQDRPYVRDLIESWCHGPRNSKSANPPFMVIVTSRRGGGEPGSWLRGMRSLDRWAQHLVVEADALEWDAELSGPKVVTAYSQ